MGFNASLNLYKLRLFQLHMPGIYIHIPFCKQACSYCDFYFLTHQQLRQPFVDALVKEIRQLKSSHFTSEPVQTIYIGGGTPSLLDQHQLHQIFSALEDVFDLQPEEVTMELNPDDVNEPYLNMIHEFGVNRASMGVQSFHDEILTFMHRAHNPQEAVLALEALQKADFPAFTADLIYGNPGQTLEMLEKDIDRLLKFNPPHISAYSLTVEPRTRLGKQVEQGKVIPADDEEVAAHFDLVRTRLAAAGVLQYEVSNFAREGKEARHNSNYWTHQNYIGLGPSAHSFWWDESGAKRWRNKPDLKFYLDHDTEQFREEKENLTMQTLAEERLMLGLRTKWGVSAHELREKYAYELNSLQKEWIEKQVEENTVSFEEGVLKMTPKGLKISDHLILDLLSKSSPLEGR